MGQVLELMPGDKLKIHWWDSARVDGLYAPLFKKPKGKTRKGTAGPYVGNIERTSVIDRVVALNGQKKGKIPEEQLPRSLHSQQRKRRARNAMMVSEYLHECLVPFMEGEELLNDDGEECDLTADEGIRGCPDFGLREYAPVMNETSILWDSARRTKR
jgi:hypothetical protein